MPRCPPRLPAGLSAAPSSAAAFSTAPFSAARGAGGPAGAPARRPRVRGAGLGAGVEVVDAPFEGADPAGAVSAAGAAPPPDSRALMASTRSDLRIRAVPLMPSWAATACSSGRRSADRLPVR